MLKKKKKSRGSRDFNCDFEFGERDGPSHDDDWTMADVMKQLKKKVENNLLRSSTVTSSHTWNNGKSMTLSTCVFVLTFCVLSAENLDNSGPENRENPPKEES